MGSATLSWAKSEFPRAGGGWTSLTLISSQLKGLMISHSKGMLYNRMGMTFLLESSIPAEAKLGSLLLLQPPADHRPGGASPGPCWSPHWAGEGRRASLLCFPYNSHCIWWNKTALLDNWSLLAPWVRRQRQESHFPSSCAPAGSPLQHPISASSLPAKVRLHLGEWGEIRARVGGHWNQTTSRLGRKPGSHRGFQLPCEYPNRAGVWQWW